MKRIAALIGIFGIALVVPLSWLILQTFASLKQEEISQLHFFANELFAQMEEDLAAKIFREESRTVDAYQAGPHSPLFHGSTGSEENDDSLSQPPRAPYIIGYFQNNPDGSFQSPYTLDTTGSTTFQGVLERLKTINTVFNQKKYQLREHSSAPSHASKSADKKDSSLIFSTRYMSNSAEQRSKKYLGRKEKRTEEISVSQAANLAQKKIEMEKVRPMEDIEDRNIKGDNDLNPRSMTMGSSAALEPEPDTTASEPAVSSATDETKALKVEVTPFQGVMIDADTLFIFRRVILQNQVYRQGFAMSLKPFVRHLADTFFLSQPLAGFTQLTFTLKNGTEREYIDRFGTDIRKPEFSLAQSFPAPFDVLAADLTCRDIPISAGRATLNYIVAALFIVVLIGFFSIYSSVRSIVDLSERRSRFVSSVTHELKTPLTNISLYIEMLEQGIARDKDKEQAYYQILSTESARLSRLIGNVLEFSRLEKKQRAFNLQKGEFTEILAEVRTLFSAKLKQENYHLNVNSKLIRPFAYDREVMIQVLINLIENSLKFGRDAALREIVIDLHQTAKHTYIAVSDNGPGIPPKFLKKVFDDFYRVKDADIQTIAGTGIGLALVKKFIHAMGGRVKAENRHPGTRITISMPS